jgi:hypothetical protein
MRLEGFSVDKESILDLAGMLLRRLQWKILIFLILSIELGRSSDRCLQRMGLPASAWRPQTGPSILPTKLCWLQVLGVQR